MFRSSNREVELSPVSSFTCGQQQDSYDIMTDQRFIKWCRVCGARALSFNFSGLSCESCKIFFRRNALKSEEFHCFHGGNCRIDVSTRKTCQKCRLDKCFAIGMRKELIILKSKSSKSSSSISPSTSPSTSSLSSPTEMLNQLLRHPIVYQNGTTTTRKELENSEDATVESPTSESTTTLVPLHPYESHCLEVIKKVHLLFSEVHPSGINVVGYASSIDEVFNNQAHLLQSAINFTRSISGFRSMCMADQTACFKEAFPEILLLRSAYFFHFEQNAFLARIDDNLDGATLVQLEMFYGPSMRETIDYHRQLAFMVKEEVDYDLIIRDLLCVLLMFKETEHVTQPEFVRYQYFSYCHLLRKYLYHKYASNEAKVLAKYENLLAIVTMVADFKKSAVNTVASKVDATKVSHLLAEIYYLKDSLPAIEAEVEGAEAKKGTLISA